VLHILKKKGLGVDFCFFAEPILNDKTIGGIKGSVNDIEGNTVFTGEKIRFVTFLKEIISSTITEVCFQALVKNEIVLEVWLKLKP